jgi:regulatory protein
VAHHDISQQCLDIAYRYLSYRPRSEGEMKQRLRKRGFDTEVIERTIGRLKEQDIIDDYAFAKFWKDAQLSHKPKSKRLIIKELVDKNVGEDIIKQVTEEIDDETNAYTLGHNRARMLTHLDQVSFRRRLENILSYRGFSYGIIKHTIDILWEERDQGGSIL